MTHVLIAADLFTLGSLFVMLIVVLIFIGAFSQGHIRPYRRRSRRSFWDSNEPINPLFGQTGLVDHFHEPNNDDLSIFKPHDNINHSTHIDNSGSILGLNDGTEPRSVNDSGGFGGLGTAAAEYFNPDNSSGGFTDFSNSNDGANNLSDWSSGGTFGDSGGYANDNCGSFTDSSSFSDSGSSFSDNSSGGTFSSDN